MSVVGDEVKNSPQPDRKDTAKSWLKRIGLIGFLFFLIKGLLWLIVPALIAYFSLK